MFPSFSFKVKNIKLLKNWKSCLPFAKDKGELKKEENDELEEGLEGREEKWLSFKKELESASFLKGEETLLELGETIKVEKCFPEGVNFGSCLKVLHIKNIFFVFLLKRLHSKFEKKNWLK